MIYLIKKGETIDYLIKAFNLTENDYDIKQGWLFFEGDYYSYIINNHDNPIVLSEKLKIPISEIVGVLNGHFQPGRLIWIRK